MSEDVTTSKPQIAMRCRIPTSCIHCACAGMCVVRFETIGSNVRNHSEYIDARFAVGITSFHSGAKRRIPAESEPPEPYPGEGLYRTTQIIARTTTPTASPPHTSRTRYCPPLRLRSLLYDSLLCFCVFPCSSFSLKTSQNDPRRRLVLSSPQVR